MEIFEDLEAIILNAEAQIAADNLRAAKRRERNAKKNARARARHQAMVDLGLKRVRGALGGIYYE